MFWFNHHHQGAYYLSLRFGGVAEYAATPLNQLQRCILTDYVDNYNFSKLK
jgi:hypothetical protein